MLEEPATTNPTCPTNKYRIGIEYEGEHHGDEGQIVRDIARSERYTALGWTEVRISKRHMHDDARAAVAKVRAAWSRPAGVRAGETRTTAPQLPF